MDDNKIVKDYVEKAIQPKRGAIALMLILLIMLAGLAMSIVGFIFSDMEGANFSGGFLAMALGGFVVIIACGICLGGLCIINPNEAVVTILFGKYSGTVAQDGFYFVNPFVKKVRISLKARTLVNDKQKVNDERGNPIEIGVIVIWKVVNTASAMFKVEDYTSYITTQADSAIRNVARKYPYDVEEGNEEKSLRGSSQEISLQLMNELQDRVKIAGIEILEARISHLAYAPEIAAAMLQRQQAEAIVQARQKIVDGAVGMVEMALNKLSERQIVELDAERKAQMVSNLLVVLCGNKDAQPIVNSGSIY